MIKLTSITTNDSTGEVTVGKHKKNVSEECWEAMCEFNHLVAAMDALRNLYEEEVVLDIFSRIAAAHDDAYFHASKLAVDTFRMKYDGYHWSEVKWEWAGDYSEAA